MWRLIIPWILLGSFNLVFAQSNGAVSNQHGATTVLSKTEAKLVIFGDSLSDNGNSYEYSHHKKPSALMYYQGRYSNGPIWLDYLSTVLFPNASQQLILNYAFGGAGVLRSQPHVFILRQEIDSYLLTHAIRPDADTWFIIWIGANDYLLHPDSKSEDVQHVITEIEHNVTRLVEHGARHIIVLGLPDLGVLPYADDLELQTPLSNLSHLHNQRLKDSIAKLKTRFAQTEWHYIDINQTFISLMTHPKQYGFKYTHARCLDPDIFAKIMEHHQKQDCRKYVFFDQFHPTTFVHHLVAKELLKNIHFLHSEKKAGQTHVVKN